MSAGRLAHRVAVVTGAGQGIGKAVAIRLAEEGASVIVTSRTVEHARQTADEITTAGIDRPETIALDVADRRRVIEVISSIGSAHGRIDVVVANAGIELAHGPSVEATKDDEWDRLFDVNVGGIFRVVRAALPWMSAGGSIVTVGSINSFIAWPNNAAYTSTKGAVLQFTKALSLEVAPRNIRANCVCPGVIDTPLTRSFLQGTDAAELESEYAAVSPLGRMGTAREVADAVLFLASDESTFITGSGLLVDGGTTAR